MRRLALAAATLAALGCGGDKTTGPGVTPDPPVVTLPTDPQALLTDAQMRTAPLDGAPAADERYAAWAAATTQPVRSLTSDTFTDLDAFLPAALAGRRVVALGESSHRVGEFNSAKVRLIKYLHQRLGYDVLAFESSIYACWVADGRAATLDAAALTRSCIYGTWHTREVLALFEYVRATRQTARPLTLAGVDNQFSSPIDRERPAFFRELAGHADTAFARRAAAVDSAFQARLASAGATVDQLRVGIVADSAHLIAGYDSLAAFLEANRATVAARRGAGGDAAVTVAAAAARSGAAYVRQWAQQYGGLTAYDVRDSAMAANLDVLLDRLYPGRKVIVWAHNAHVQRDRSGTTSTPTGVPAFRSMGEWVARRRGAEYYAVGLFMLRGTMGSTSSAFPDAVRAPGAGSLESILSRARRRHLFLDLAGLARTADSEWLFRPAPAFYWGMTPELQVLRDQYDGILFLDTVGPPAWL